MLGKYSVLNMKVGAFNRALVGDFSVIVKSSCGTDGSFYSTINKELCFCELSSSSVFCPSDEGHQGRACVPVL